MHRLTDIHHNLAAQICFCFKLLDVVFICFGPCFPIQVPDVISSDILSMLNEFDRVSKERAAMHTGDEAFDNVLGTYIQPADFRNCLGMEEAPVIVSINGSSHEIMHVLVLGNSRLAGLVS